jgi:hypothetical protein
MVSLKFNLSRVHGSQVRLLIVYNLKRIPIAFPIKFPGEVLSPVPVRLERGKHMVVCLYH